MKRPAPAHCFAPSLPTLSPLMLLRSADVDGYWPMCVDRARYFYFARNGIWLMARMLRLDEGEVLVPAYHHGVEIESLIDTGAQVRFYRVGARWDVDLDDVERSIGPRTRALYLIHYAGFPGPVREMRRLADRHGLPLIEDCALSLLSRDGDLDLGATGDVSIFCLYKTLPVPNGGALVVNRPQAVDLDAATAPAPLASTVNHALSSMLQRLELRGGAFGRWARARVRAVGQGTVRAARIERVPTGSQHFNRDHVHLAMSALSHRIAFAQDLRRIVEVRRRNFLFLLERLRDLVPPLFTELPPGACPLFYPLVVPERAALFARLNARGVEAIEFWRDGHPACALEPYPEVAALRRTVLEIPCHQDLSLGRMAAVADVLESALAEDRRTAAVSPGIAPSPAPPP